VKNDLTTTHVGRIALIVLAVLLGGIVGFYYGAAQQYANFNEDNSMSFATSLTKHKGVPTTATPTNSATPSVRNGYTLYSNPQYGYSLQYPSNWTSSSFSSNKDVVGIQFASSVVFKDSTMANKITCNNYKYDHWNTADANGFTQAQCEAIIATETASEISNLNGPVTPEEVFVRVYSNTGSQLVSDWLMSKYRVANTELADYTSGKVVALDGVSGLTSQIGCCTAYDFSYVVSNGNYIYQLGTRSRISGTGDKRSTFDNTTLRAIAETFKFTK